MKMDSFRWNNIPQRKVIEKFPRNERHSSDAARKIDGQGYPQRQRESIRSPL